MYVGEREREEKKNSCGERERESNFRLFLHFCPFVFITRPLYERRVFPLSALAMGRFHLNGDCGLVRHSNKLKINLIFVKHGVQSKGK